MHVELLGRFSVAIFGYVNSIDVIAFSVKHFQIIHQFATVKMAPILFSICLVIDEHQNDMLVAYVNCCFCSALLCPAMHAYQLTIDKCVSKSIYLLNRFQAANKDSSMKENKCGKSCMFMFILKTICDRLRSKRNLIENGDI